MNIWMNIWMQKMDENMDEHMDEHMDENMDERGLADFQTHLESRIQGFNHAAQSYVGRGKSAGAKS